jgi:hypothetical protein
MSSNFLPRFTPWMVTFVPPLTEPDLGENCNRKAMKITTRTEYLFPQPKIKSHRERERLRERERGQI